MTVAGRPAFEVPGGGAQPAGGAAPGALAVRDLLVRHGGRTVLSVSSLAVAEGEALALLGPNGAGKSTLLRCLALLQRPSGGLVSLRGVPLAWRDAVDYRRRTATLLQEPVLFDTTVYENVAAGMRLRGVARGVERRRVDEWLERLDIAHLRLRAARTLSGGEARRVSLARAMVLEPEILFLDEPCAGLDAEARASFIRELAALLDARRTTTVLVTHDRAEARALADRVAVLIDGMVAGAGAAADVLDHPVDPRVRAFLRAAELPLPRSAARSAVYAGSTV